MSATVIMPSEGTTEKGDWTGEGACLWAGPSEREEAIIQSRLAEELADEQSAQWNPSMRHFVLFLIKTEVGPHKNSQSVCLLCCCSQLIGPNMNLPD